jgi:DivIVA domain-containing protein
MKDKDAVASSGVGGRGDRRLTPADVQQKEFRVSFRGYNERDVDEFLDLVTEELQRYETELMRLRSERVSFDPASFDLDDETRRLLDDARNRADSIVRQAEARAAGIPTASGADTRAVVAPYLNHEREFLQSLGALIQGHANTIKTMVEEARRRTEPAAAPEAAPSSAPPSPIESAPAPSIEASGGAGHDVVLLGDEPVTTPAERSDDDREPEGGRSLRELFWGED